ncbi:hypothetical protein RRG08_050606 [Elysia crispata]|uniref:Uncharacterized protein n=1 Tax=Elysia crispata TaxID=231223 RepID=A0AAE1E3N1_9GAST|nr:hypothetical protein RRG08_050606 [Elysia crispata]
MHLRCSRSSLVEVLNADNGFIKDDKVTLEAQVTFDMPQGFRLVWDATPFVVLRFYMHVSSEPVDLKSLYWETKQDSIHHVPQKVGQAKFMDHFVLASLLDYEHLTEETVISMTPEKPHLLM